MKKVFCLLFAGMFICGCEPKLPVEPEKPEEWPKGQNVYVAGVESVQGYPTARVWKNGEIQPLAGGNYADEAFSVFVSNEDVYVLGKEWLAASKYGPWAFKYWKNGKAVIFAEGGTTLSCNSIFVSNGTV